MSLPMEHLPLDAAQIAARLARARRILVFGAMGSGKSTLVSGLADAFSRTGDRVLCIGADPGTPAFGPPGTVCLARRSEGTWALLALEPLCTLDAVRFRLPLVQAVERLARGSDGDRLLVDAPGIVLGVAGAEMLTALAQAARVDAVLLVAPAEAPAPLAAELASLGCEVLRVPADAAARRPSTAARERSRTRAWDAALADAAHTCIDVDALVVVGTPPPREAPEAWAGRQIALLEKGRLLALGEAKRLEAATLTVQLAHPAATRIHPESAQEIPAATADTLLIRDAGRDGRGRLVTLAGRARSTPATHGPATGDAAVEFPTTAVHVDAGTIAARIVNGVFGDPLLELKLRDARERLLFDLGDAARLSRRVLHTVTDVFVSHAHLDHFCGMIDLLRARMTGAFPPCRIYGPPGIRAHVAATIAGIHWDRIGEEGPVFDVAEIHDTRLDWTRIKVGRPGVELESTEHAGGTILECAGLAVRATRLDHGIAVFAYSLETRDSYRIGRQRLLAANIPSGPWLRELKSCLARGDHDATIALPDGRRPTVAALGAELATRIPGRRLVYATDFADTPANREALVAFASHADLLVCEATFMAADADQAARTQHLTARACGEIARSAEVGRLVPFHFSKRYTADLAVVYAEVRAACGGIPVVEAAGR